MHVIKRSGQAEGKRKTANQINTTRSDIRIEERGKNQEH